MGYSTLRSRNESSGSLGEAIPLLKNNFDELREWTVQLFMAATPQPNLPIYSVNTIYPFQSPVPSQYQAFSIHPHVYLPHFPAPAPPQQSEAQPRSFFGDEFALPPAFLTEDQPRPGAPAVPADDPAAATEFRLSPMDPLFQGDDAFGLYSDKR
jgi:hypothetical protein